MPDSDAPRDSGRVPFAGRSLPDPGFAGDDGSPDARLVAALQAFAADATAEGELLAALSVARLLVPLVAAAADGEDGADMALMTLVGADGRRALPVFTGSASLAAWHSSARPVPVDASRAALAAAAEDADAMVVDIAGPVTYVLEGRSGLEAMARGTLVTPAYEDTALRTHVAAILADWPAVVSAAAVPAEGLDARVDITLDAPVTDADVARVGESLRAAPRLLVHGLGLAVVDVLDEEHCFYRRGRQLPAARQ